MPGRILDVIWIDGPMRFELSTAVVVAADVVERDAALPQLWHDVRRKRGDAVEARDGFGDAAGEEVVDGPIQQRARVAAALTRQRC